MEYTIVISFTSDEQEHAEALVQAIAAIAPYMVDNVDISLDEIEREPILPKRDVPKKPWPEDMGWSVR